MKDATIAALEEVCETLMNYICDPRKGSGTQDPAIRALVTLRDALPDEEEPENSPIDTKQGPR